MKIIQQRSITVRGFMNVEFIEQQPTFLKEAAGWIADGRLNYREDIIDGLENAPDASSVFFGGIISASWSSGCRASDKHRIHRSS
jgi:NADPH-dependent curcumin reductase CurA